MRDPFEAACTAFLNAEFDELGSAWFHPSERANFIHNGRSHLEPKMRTALTAYLKAVRYNSFGQPPLSKMIADVGGNARSQSGTTYNCGCYAAGALVGRCPVHNCP